MTIRARRGLITGLAVLLLATSACASRPQVSAAPPVDDAVAWTPFQWVKATVGGRTFERAAILVPITADALGGTYWLQLDTGADTDVWLYTAPLDQLLRRSGAERDTTAPFRISRGRIGAHPLQDHAVNIRRFPGDTVRGDDPHPKIGTLGLNFFRSRVLLIDFPAERFAVLDPVAELPDWIATQASWVSIDYRDDKLFVPLVMAGTTYTDFFYDSGASLFPVSTTRKIWRRSTGRNGDEPDNKTWTVPSFGEPATFIGAPARGRVSVGEASMARPMGVHTGRWTGAAASGELARPHQRPHRQRPLCGSLSRHRRPAAPAVRTRRAPGALTGHVTRSFVAASWPPWRRRA